MRLALGTKTWAGLDIVALPKQDDENKNSIQPPKTGPLVRVHEMSNCYRQAMQPFMAYKYMLTHHAWETFPLSWAETVNSDDEGRCPLGHDSVWIQCSVNVSAVEALRILKQIFDEESTDVNLTVTVLGSVENVLAYCGRQGWAFVPVNEIFGSECDVKLSF